MVEICLLGVWGALLTHGVSVMIQCAGRTAAPISDSRLAAIDQSIGFSTSAVVHWIANFPFWQRTFAIAYDSVMPLIILALFLPVLCGHTRNAQRYLLAVVIGAAITGALYAFVPATGPWFAHGYQPSHDQSMVQAYIEMLKAGQWMRINQETAGVVTFPSFHTVLAILPIAAMWPIRHTRIPAIVVAVMICMSTITTGWHYGIDVLGGLAVALLSHTLANYGMRKLGYSSHFSAI